MSGSACRLRYHCGCSGAPPLLATAAKTPSCSTRMRGTLRTAPDLAPRIVSSTTGRCWMCTESVVPVRSISSTCRRTQSLGLGTYSPIIAMPRTLTRPDASVRIGPGGAKGDVPDASGGAGLGSRAPRVLLDERLDDARVEPAAQLAVAHLALDLAGGRVDVGRPVRQGVLLAGREGAALGVPRHDEELVRRLLHGVDLRRERLEARGLRLLDRGVVPEDRVAVLEVVHEGLDGGHVGGGVHAALVDGRGGEVLAARGRDRRVVDVGDVRLVGAGADVLARTRRGVVGDRVALGRGDVAGDGVERGVLL